MKLTSIFMIALTFNVSVAANSQTISFSGKNVTAKKMLSVIKEQTSYVFFYDVTLLKNVKPVSINVANATVEKVLQETFKETPVTWIVQGKTISLIAKPETKVEKTISAPVSVKITGIITDPKGSPLPGVNVVEKGTKNGVQTDFEGKFTLNIVNENAVLIISYIGFQTKEIKVGNQTTIAIALIEDSAKLDEIVVVGYGTKKRGSVTSSVSTIKGDLVARQPVASLSNSLAGRSTGIIATQSSGEPGSDGSNILIRGISTIGNSQPLVIVDGVPRNYSQLDPNSIASISVLKDAAAVAPYGMAGANGVILVTTKTGTSGATKFTFNSYYGLQNPTTLTKFVNSYEYATLMNAAKDNEGASHVYSEADLQKFLDHSSPDTHPDSDVLKELITPNAMITSQNLALAGGTEKFKYYAAIGHLSQQGMWGPSKFERYNIISNLDIQAAKNTKVSLSINGRVEDRNAPAVSSSGIFYQAFRTPPVAPVTFSNGLPGGWIGSSVYGNIFNSGYNKSVGYTLLNQLSVEQQLPFVKGLSVKAVVSYDYNPGDQNNPGGGIMSFSRKWATPISFYTVNTSTNPYTYPLAGNGGPVKPQFYEDFAMSQAFTYQGYLNYQRTFDKHDVKGLIVLESRNTKFSQFGGSRMNYDVLIPELNNGSSASVDINNYGFSTEGRQKSGLYRLSYAYADKYMFEAAGRYDGNYYFAPGKRFGFFPAFSAGWRISEEQFMKDNFSWVTNFKIRGSYGESGALAGSPFQYLRSYSLFSGASVIAGNPSTGMVENSEPNINITWERAKKANIGFEASFWNGLLTAEADFFMEKRNNMLASPNIVVPIEYGVGISQENAASMSNKGFELALGSSHRFSNDMVVSLNLNASFTKNKLEQVFENSTTYDNPNRRVTGRSLGTQFGYNAIGFFKPEDFNQDGSLKEEIPLQSWGSVHPGDIRYEDTWGPNGKPDGKIDENDIVPIGKSFVPEIIYGISPSITYKGFDLNLLFQGASNRDFYISGAGAWPFYSSSSATKDNLDYWTPTNQDAKNPRITSSPSPNNMVTSSFWVRNGNYLRLKTGELGYTLPKNLANEIKVESLRLYVSGQNLLTWSTLKNFDPEVSDTQGMYYPQQKVVSVGLNVTF